MLPVLPLVHGSGKLRWVMSEIDMGFDRENPSGHIDFFAQ
jgi:hypothetical protein